MKTQRKRPEVTWSLMHPTPLDPGYVRRVLAKTSEYEVDSIEICGECHTPYGGLDGLIDYHEYPHAGSSWDRDKVADNRAKMREILSLAHAAGKAVYLWHREVMIPPRLLEDLPALLDEDGEFDLLGGSFAELLRGKLDRVFEVLPELDGVVLTLTEADFSTIHNSNARRYPPMEVVRFIVDIFASELEKRGKFFSMRSFGSIAEDYECILGGIEKLAGKYHFEVETKITPYDFDPFLPDNPFLRKSPGCTLAAECDGLGEFLGQGFLPFAQTERILRYVRTGQQAGVDRFVIRLDRHGNSVFDLYELNYAAYDRALHDPNVTAETIRREWYEKHAPHECRDTLAELDDIGWEMVCKTFFIDRQVLFHGNWCMKYLKAAFAFALFAEGRRTLANGSGIWSVLTDRETVGRAAILTEKNRAVALADKGLALLKTIGLPPEDPRHRLWRNAVIVTRAVREFARCVVAYFDDMEWEKADFPHLKAQVAASLAELDRLAEQRRQEPVDDIKQHFSEADRTLDEAVLIPLASICRELLTEFSAEFTAREKFLTGSEDGVIAGGITDDWRIVRYMHGAHAILHYGLPARQAGNRVFPNGFIEVELKRGEELVVFGAPEETRCFTLTCDGKRMAAEFDGNGVFSLPLPPSEQKVSVRLEKNGAVYPLFYAIATRNRDWKHKPRIPLFVSRDTLMPKDVVPEPVYDAEPGWTDLYYAAWQSAWTHIFSCRKAPVSPYMNEGIRCHKIWIWDTCFMAQFCRYAAADFPGIQSLDNFYRVMHDGENTGLKVHIPDNPPLFAWTEYEYFKHTGDIDRIRRILLEHRYLQRHYRWLNESTPGVLFDYATSQTAAKFIPGKGFLWHGDRAGMDNTPRGDDDFSSIYYVDLSCQQALSALYIARLAEAVGEKELSRTWFGEYEAQKDFVNARFWSAADRMYFDRKVDESGFCKVLTPASLWPMLAEIADREQAAALADALADPGKLGGERPLPSVSRDDPRFSPAGAYWRGGIWVPTVYMAVKGLEKNKLQTLADDIARRMISQQYRTWRDVEPRTIWECYSPTEDKPATNKVDVWSRPDFCGWSALGPISLFIENVLGIREVDALKKRISWTPLSSRKSGIRNLKMGGRSFSLISCPETGIAEVEAEEDFTLSLNGRDIHCAKGKSVIRL